MGDKPEVTTQSWDKSTIEFLQQPVPNIYTNSAKVQFSNFDVTIDFGEILGAVEGKLRIAPKLRVTMSLQHAKAFVKLLNENIGAFEGQFGPIQEITMPESKEPKEAK